MCVSAFPLRFLYSSSSNHRILDASGSRDTQPRVEHRDSIPGKLERPNLQHCSHRKNNIRLVQSTPDHDALPHLRHRIKNKKTSARQSGRRDHQEAGPSRNQEAGPSPNQEAVPSRTCLFSNSLVLILIWYITV